MMDTLNAMALDATMDNQRVASHSLELYTKLRRICRTIHVAKGALTVKKLSNRQAGAAELLIREIERCVEHLGKSTRDLQDRASDGLIPASARINHQLNDLSLLCEELVSAVAAPPA